MKKIFLSTFVLLLVGSAAVAQEKASKPAAASTKNKSDVKKEISSSKTQVQTAKVAADKSGRKAPAVSATASLAEYNAAKAN